MATSKVNIDEATEEELLSLPGIGEKRAGTLLKLRKKYGHISKDRLSEVIGGSLSQSFLSLVEFSAPPEDEAFESKSKLTSDESDSEKVGPVFFSPMKSDPKTTLEHVTEVALPKVTISGVSSKEVKKEKSLESGGCLAPEKHSKKHVTYRSSSDDESPERRHSHKHSHRRRSDNSSDKSRKTHKCSKHRHHKDRSHSKKHHRKDYSSTSDSDSSSYTEDDDKHGNPSKLPKNLRYDGTTSWLSFKQKFDSYRRVNGWSNSEARDYLHWCLEGKALDFFAIQIHLGEDYSFHGIMRKLENRFGSNELPETSTVKFQQAMQKPGECLEDWSDRVLTLATPAFRDLLEHYSQKEAIAKFCQGCLDKEAGKHACLERPQTMQKAVDLVRHHQYVTHIVDGKKSRRQEAEFSVNALTQSEEKRMDNLEKMIQILTEQVGKIATQNKSNGSLNRVFYCYFCNGKGHMKKNCFQYKRYLSTQVSNKDLNGKGSEK